MTRTHPRIFGMFLCFASTAVLAQQYTIKKIVFNGIVPYSQASLEAASGLRPLPSVAAACNHHPRSRRIFTPTFSFFQTASVVHAVAP